MALDNYIYGTAGDDSLTGTGLSDGIYGYEGNDEAYGGEGDDEIEGGAGDDTLHGDAGNDRVDGGDGNDFLHSDAGNDTLIGGTGDDYLYVKTGDTLIEALNEGTDVVVAEESWTLGDNIEGLFMLGTGHFTGLGNGLNNILGGNSGNNLLDGGGGGEMDWMVGDGGDDTYVVDSALDVVVENADNGSDTVRASVSVTLADHVENLELTGAAAVSATGNSLSNRLTGNAAANTLAGGAGDDTYVIDALDTVQETSAGGVDTIEVAFSYTLGSFLENLTLTGGSSLNGQGNNGNNVLTGNSGANVLKGYGGTDTLVGGGGNDLYYLDSTDDVVTEQSGEGTDTVYAKSGYTLSDHVERLTLLEGFAAATGGMGNAGANTLTGNSLANVLDGGGGKDALYGKTGNDTYVVDSADDTTVELAGEGTDTVRSSLNWTLGANVENLELTGTANLKGQGNTLANVLSGNAGNNVLKAYDGRDTVSGGLGNDSFYVDSSDDVVIEQSGEGTDTVYSRASFTLGAHVDRLTLLEGYAGALDGTGNGDANVLTGNGLGNVLRGGAGNDTLVGKAGNDRYEFGRGDGKDTVTDQDATAGNTDQLYFLSGVSREQLWFSQSGTDLVVSVIGTQDRVTVRQWYVSGDYRVEEIRTADGDGLLSWGNVGSLVTAMASFTPPAPGVTSLSSPAYDPVLAAIAAAWS